MCFDYVSNPNAIILAVTAANQDLANSDGKYQRDKSVVALRPVCVLFFVKRFDQ